MEYAQGFFEFNGGTLSAYNCIVSNGLPFRVGNGVSAATFLLASNTMNTFVNGLIISNNATLTGNGTVPGTVTVSAGGKLAPGAPIGKLVFGTFPTVQGTTIMEISRNGLVLTNDQIQWSAANTYNGSLIVSNVGPTALAAGDNFKLFSAGGYFGAFSAVSLPLLSPGLNWTNCWWTARLK